MQSGKLATCTCMIDGACKLGCKSEDEGDFIVIVFPRDLLSNDEHTEHFPVVHDGCTQKGMVSRLSRF